MNAEAYLRKQGWQGSGHSLDKTGRGIKKPLLIAHKNDQLGLGKKKAAHTTDDQWWLRAFDQSLQSIGTGKDSTLDQIRTQGIYRGGLYGFFVKGESEGGTIGDTSAATTDTSDKKSKRKRDDKGEAASKKTKKTKNEAATPKTLTQDSGAVAKKLAKLKPAEKVEYETRAAEKGQTLEQYVLRRIQKKTEKNTSEPEEASKDKKQKKSDKKQKKLDKATKKQ
ncbi:dna-directed rna polymerase ii subunit rpb1 protein [Stemphylium lycopersici]|nr:dna-directed rna polymerase ii subunit rpb1 protein [Stemphylium lycopersici]